MNPAALSALAKGDLENFMAASTPGDIEAQEKAGQGVVCNSELLPIDCGRGKHIFESLGFIFGDPVDRIFVRGTLPPGWLKKPTDHDMWSNLVDEKGRKRGSLFYKAAFYDRSAHMHLCNRFSIDGYADGSDKDHLSVVITDCGDPVEKIGEYKSHRDWETKDALVETAKAWLTEHYPDWESPVAYWD